LKSIYYDARSEKHQNSFIQSVCLDVKPLLGPMTGSSFEALVQTRPSLSWAVACDERRGLFCFLQSTSKSRCYWRSSGPSFCRGPAGARGKIFGF